MNNPQELPFLRLSGGTMSGALNMNGQDITNGGDITSQHASGYLLNNADGSASGVITVAPRRDQVSLGLNGQASDLILYRGGAIGLQISGGTYSIASTGVTSSTPTDFTFTDDLVIQGADADRGGATLTCKLNAMSATLAAAATHSFSAAIPAGAVVIGVTTRVTTTITGCTTIDIGVGGAATRYGTGIALTSGTTTTNAAWASGTSALVYPAATDLVITAVGGGASFTAGAMRVCVYYLAPTAPTS